ATRESLGCKERIASPLEHKKRTVEYAYGQRTRLPFRLCYSRMSDVTGLCTASVSSQQIEIKCFAMTTDRSILEMAISGYEVERKKIEEKIAEIKASLGGKSEAVVSSDGAKSKRKPLSKTARKRIALAQRKRWKEYRAGQKGS